MPGRDLGADPDDAAIVDMARSLNLSDRTEGVEAGEQTAFLRFLACDQAQGYYVGRPMPAAECVARLGTGIVKRSLPVAA